MSAESQRPHPKLEYTELNNSICSNNFMYK